MFIVLAFFVEFLLLFFLSKSLSRLLSQVFYIVSHNKTITVYLLSFLFLPGIVVHELSHLLTAAILFVPVGEMEFIPQIDPETDSVKLGSVMVGKTDPVRRAIIGAAPFVVGLAIILGSLFYFTALSLPISETLKFILELFIVFEVGNTMFSSEKDLEGTLELLAVILVVLIALFFIGARVPQSIPNYFSSSAAMTLFKKTDLLFLVPIGLDLLVIGVLKVI